MRVTLTFKAPVGTRRKDVVLATDCAVPSLDTQRALLAAEQTINALGDLRLHIGLSESESTPKRRAPRVAEEGKEVANG